MFSTFQPDERRRLMLVLALLAVAYGLFLFWRGFFDPDEGRYGEIPREMVANGNWMEMRMMDFRYYEKPILSYWLTAPAIAALGAHDWAARLPLLLPLLGTLWLLLGLVRRHWPREQHAPALLVAFSTIGLFSQFGLLMTDTFLVFWFALTCVALFEAYAAGATPAQRRNGLLLTAVAGALGFMTKGAVAIVLPGAALFVWLLWERRLRQLWTWWLLAAAALFLAILVPWLLWLERHNPGFIQYFVIDEHLSRFTGTRSAQGHPEPFWFFLAVTPVMLLPWTLFAVRAVARGWGRHDSLTRFLVCWAVLVIVFFSVSSGKLMSYILPAFPALGLLLGRWGVGEPAAGTSRDTRHWRLGLAGPLLVLAAFALLWVVSWFQLLPEQIPQISGAGAWFFLPLALAVWFARRALRSLAGVGLLVATALLLIALLCSPLTGLNTNVRMHLNNSILYKQFAAQLRPEDQFVMFFDYRPALVFYTRRQPVIFQFKNELEYGMNAERQRRGSVETFDQLRAIVQACPGKTYGFVDPPDLEKRLGPVRDALLPTAFPTSSDTIVFEVKFPGPPAQK
jgi:4-amino-4-deoxy-L-arabinose transferase-like glycosyltransferase